VVSAERGAITTGGLRAQPSVGCWGGFKIVEFEFRVRVRVSSNFSRLVQINLNIALPLHSSYGNSNRVTDRVSSNRVTVT